MSALMDHSCSLEEEEEYFSDSDVSHASSEEEYKSSGSSRDNLRLQFSSTRIYVEETTDDASSATLSRLGFNNVDKNLVERLAGELKDDSSPLAPFFARIKALADAATTTQEEIKTSKPISTIISHILSQEQNVKRHVSCTGEVSLKSGLKCVQALVGKPDLRGTESSAKAKFWSDLDFWGEFKAQSSAKPYDDLPNTSPKRYRLTDFGTQATDYARNHVSTRPFQFYSVGLLIFGVNFCVAIYDRDRVTFSPVRDMWKRPESFVRTILALGCATPAQLGVDPTVTKVPLNTHITGLTAEDREDYPSYIVAPLPGDERSWVTFGQPIAVALSLLGRGTLVWHVRATTQREDGTYEAEGPTRILKSAWRSSQRLQERIIYEYLNRVLKGACTSIAKVHAGGDVQGPDGRVISVHRLRPSNAAEGVFASGTEVEQSHLIDTPVLHRLVFDTAGDPVWKFTNPLQLLRAMLDVIKVHKDLCNRGILHRDISAGNVLFHREPPEATVAFLNDFDLAYLSEALLDAGHKDYHKDRELVPRTRPEVNAQYQAYSGSSGVAPEFAEDQPSHMSWDVVKRGAAMTGTLQFMPVAILKASSTGNPIKHEARHDLESLLYVLGYAILRHYIWVEPAPRVVQKELKKRFFKAFGQASIEEVLANRQALSQDHPIGWFHFLAEKIVEDIDAFEQGFGSDEGEQPLPVDVEIPEEIRAKWFAETFAPPVRRCLLDLFKVFQRERAKPELQPAVDNIESKLQRDVFRTRRKPNSSPSLLQATGDSEFTHEKLIDIFESAIRQLTL